MNTATLFSQTFLLGSVGSESIFSSLTIKKTYLRPDNPDQYRDQSATHHRRLWTYVPRRRCRWFWTDRSLNSTLLIFCSRFRKDRRLQVSLSCVRTNLRLQISHTLRFDCKKWRFICRLGSLGSWPPLPSSRRQDTVAAELAFRNLLKSRELWFDFSRSKRTVKREGSFTFCRF